MAVRRPEPGAASPETIWMSVFRSETGRQGFAKRFNLHENRLRTERGSVKRARLVLTTS
jgi:hypothetical protein